MFGRKLPTFHDNHEIGQKQVEEIVAAIEERRPARFHAGCNSCVWRHMNTSHEGIAFCRGCSYFAWDRDLPDKSRERILERR